MARPMKFDAPLRNLGSELLVHLFGSDGVASLRSGNWKFISVVAPVFGFFADVSTIFGHPAPYLLIGCAVIGISLAVPIAFRTKYYEYCAIPCVFAFILTISFSFVVGTQKVFAAEDTGIAAKAIPGIPELQETLAKSLGIQTKMLATVEDIHSEIRKLNQQFAEANERAIKTSSPSEPVYKIYTSTELGVTLAFPNNILSLDTTERKQGILTFRDGEGHPRVKVLRTALPDLKDVKLGRQHEKEQLERLSYTLTYVAPERDQNWKNWYVLSGVKNNTAFYFRRWYVEDSVVSIEFLYPKELDPLYDKLIPMMTQELVYAATSPKINP
jgi:hypothetical protein